MPIYDGVKDILKARKAPHITNEYIDKLCNDVVKVMESWNSFFSVLQKKTPTEEDRSKVEGIAKNAVDRHISLLGNITPKVHVAEDHAVDQYLSVRPGLVRLLIEHWVELNHQVGYRIKQQFKHERNIGRKAEFIAAKMHKQGNPEIQQKITEVHISNKRKCNVPGKYTKKRGADAITPSPPRQQPPSSNDVGMRLDVCSPVTTLQTN